MNRIRTAAVLAASLVLATASCSVSSDSDDTTSSSTATTAEVTTSETASTDAVDTTQAATTEPTTPPTTIEVRGVSVDSIKLGVALIDVDAVKEQFGVDLGHIPEGIAEALAEQINAAGGINGRNVEVVVRKFLPVGSESSETACRELIEDEQVYAVLGSFLGDAGLCVTETHATPYFAGFGLNEERQQRSQAPFLSIEGDALSASIQKAIDTGVLADHKVAVYFESDTAQSVIDTKVVAPLEAAGIEVVSQAQLPSSGDAVQAANDIDVIFQRFQADGADALVSVSGATVLLPALERTEWRPQLVFTNGQFTSDGGLDNLGLTDYSRLDGAVAISMSLLSKDLVDDQQLLECLDAVNTSTGTDYTTDDIFDPSQKPNSRQIGMVPGLCQVWDMTVAVLTAAGADLSPGGLLAGLDQVGTFPIPGYPEAELSSTRWGAVDSVRLWHFDEATHAFVPDAG